MTNDVETTSGRSKHGTQLQIESFVDPIESGRTKGASKSYDPNYEKLIEKLNARNLAIAEKNKGQPPSSEPPSSGAVTRSRKNSTEIVLQDTFPLWDDDLRGVPNPFVRSGLFSVRNSETRAFVPKMKVDSLANYDLRYSGMELQQSDLSVWMFLINLLRQKKMTDSVHFTGYSLIKDLGWRMHSESYKRAKESIERLKLTSLEILSPELDKCYAGSLIREYAWQSVDAQDGEEKWMVTFEPKISVLFLEDTTTLLEWETRKLIGSRAHVALWLHSFYSSHRDPIPLAVSKIHEICRSGDSLRSFKRNVKTALQRLIEVGFLADFHIDGDDVLHVKKLPRAARLAAAKQLKIKSSAKKK